jgi:chloramphenicol-sensitive protein RarD
MTEHDTRAGFLYSGITYVIWGLMPLYWHLLDSVSAFEVTVHRVLWCAVVVAAVVLVRGRLFFVAEALRDRRLLATMALTGILIATNWGIYIWAVDSGQLVQASLGYYINPLITIALGVVLLGERMSRMRQVAFILACMSVAVQTVAFGRFPAVALALAFTFSVYGYLRKTARIGSLEGVFVEAGLLFPITLALVASWGWQGTGALFARNPQTDVLLLMSGPATALPLALFAAGARRMTLSTLGFLQYLSPSITLLVATLYFHETSTLTHAAAFGCVWAALALLAMEKAPARLRRAMQPARQKS